MRVGCSTQYTVHHKQGRREGGGGVGGGGWGGSPHFSKKCPSISILMSKIQRFEKILGNGPLHLLKKKKV